MLFNESFDRWIRDMFLWTFEHEVISFWLIFVPLILWIVIGLFSMLLYAAREGGNEGWGKAFTIVGGYVLVPIIYWLVAGYIGNLIFQ